MMKKVLILLISVFILFNSGCKQKSDNNKLFFKIKQDINYEIIPYDEILGNSMQIKKKEDYLLINDFRGDTLIHLFDNSRQKLIRKLIPVGNGPNELISPLEIHFRNKKLFVFCRQTGILYSIPSDSLMNGGDNMTKEFQVSSEINHLYPLTDSLFISSGFFDQKQYELINHLGEKIDDFGEFPDFWSGEEGFPNAAKSMFHQTCFIKHPARPLFVTYSSHILGIYSFLDVNHIHLIKRIPMAKYKYSYTMGEISSAEKTPDTEKGVVDVACSTDYIYIIYNPNKDYEDNQKVQIQIIDWDGNPIKVLNSEKGINCITIDEKEKRAYCIIEDPNDTLVSFDL